MNYKNEDRWTIKNPEKLQKFKIGDCFYYKDQVLKIGHVSSTSGITNGSDHGHFFTMDDTGYVEKVTESLDTLLSYFAEKDLIFKVAPTGYEDDLVVYTPVYEVKND